MNVGHSFHHLRFVIIAFIFEYFCTFLSFFLVFQTTWRREGIRQIKYCKLLTSENLTSSSVMKKVVHSFLQTKVTYVLNVHSFLQTKVAYVVRIYSDIFLLVQVRSYCNIYIHNIIHIQMATACRS